MWYAARKAETTRQLAENMVKKGLPMDTVVEIMGLTPEVVGALEV